MGQRNPAALGYCGLACGMCENACDPDCKGGGGHKGCHHRECCKARGLEGCWECEAFPCNKEFFASGGDDAWRGICIGSVECIKELGVEEYLRRAGERLGNPLPYGNYRYLDPEAVKEKLCAD